MLLAILLAGCAQPSLFAPGVLMQAGNWIPYGGIWTVHDHEIDNSLEERGGLLVTRASAGDVVVDADLSMGEPDGRVGLVVRSSGEEVGDFAFHGYFAGVRVADATLEFGRADFGWRPMVRVALPEGVHAAQSIHLQVVALGCSFGVMATLPDGERSALTASDPSCEKLGHVGLRSSGTSAIWAHLAVREAHQRDLDAMKQDAAHDAHLSLSDSYAVEHTAQFEETLRLQAQRHSVQAGVQSITSFLMQPGVHPNVTLQGEIISMPPLVAIQDDTNALIIPHLDPSTPVKLGDVVIAQGTLVSERYRSRLEDAKLRVLWSDVPMPPLLVTAAQLTAGTYRGRSVELEGTLVSDHSTTNERTMVLRDGGLLFLAVSAKDSQVARDHLENGSRLRIRGLATSLTEFTGGLYPFAVLITQATMVSSPPWWSPRHIALLILLCAALVFAAQALIHRTQQWQLESVMKQREQLALEMHDTLAQSFTGIAYQLQAASMERRGEGRVQSHVQHALEMVQQSHKEASRTIAALRPQLRDAGALVKALEEGALRLADGGALRIKASLSGSAAPLPVPVTDALFRIGQEAISNAIQHSGATTLTIELAVGRREAALTVHDNGHGFDTHAIRAGLGISGMRSRAAKVKAQLEIDTGPDGTNVAVRTPLRLASTLLREFTNRLRSSSHGQRRTLDEL